MNFAELVALELQLETLRREAAWHHADAGPGFCANSVWYEPGGLKDRLCLLVGWGRPQHHAVLSTSEAYDVAYDTVYHSLPDCAHVGLICP